jgi:hypothetical protein
MLSMLTGCGPPVAGPLAAGPVRAAAHRDRRGYVTGRSGAAAHRPMRRERPGRYVVGG